MHFCMQNIALETSQQLLNQFQCAHFHNNSPSDSRNSRTNVIMRELSIEKWGGRGSVLLAIMKYAFLHEKYYT